MSYALAWTRNSREERQNNHDGNEGWNRPGSGKCPIKVTPFSNTHWVYRRPAYLEGVTHEIAGLL